MTDTVSILAEAFEDHQRGVAAPGTSLFEFMAKRLAAASPQGEGSSGDEAVVDRMVQRFLAFGHGRFVVDTGSFHQTPAVFICPVDRPGKVGASARSLGHDRHTLLPGEMVLTFPFFQQAQAVADALVTPPPTEGVKP